MDYTNPARSRADMPAAVAQSVLATPAMRSHKYRSALFAAALLLALTAIVYSAAWMYYVRLKPTVEIGIDTNYLAQAIEITNVYRDSPAEKAGLKPHDRIVAINGSSADSASAWDALLFHVWLSSHPGDTVALTVQRPGQSQPLVIRPWFRALQGAGDTKTLARTVADQILESYPLLFLIVGLAVLFLRVEDRNAWLLALVFATFITAADMPNEFAAATPNFRFLLLAYRTLMGSVLTGLFYFFFAVFPTRSPIDRKVPWLKWALPVIGACLCLGGYRHGNSRALPFILAVVPDPVAQTARQITSYGALLLGVLSLLLNVLSPSNVAERRKLKVILWGTAVGITPIVIVKAAEDFVGFRTPFWLNFVDVLLLFLFPLSFAYAVVKHRVMEIPVLLKRSARYFVVERGFVFLILAISVGATFWLAQAFSRHFSAGSKAAIPVGATFGVLLISGATQVHRRVRTRLDRAFFRSSYDAQQILENLAAKTLTVSSREGLAALLHDQIQDALHPISMYVYLEAGNGQLQAYAGNPPAEAMTLSTSG
ncbi:MAG TPA: PDZ domain-containing protein, partial [Candidatus Limnocylindrales bacterium]|nr:PDZ domain-containing protein [Candidatus Limnocylindrales bacterium]